MGRKPRQPHRLDNGASRESGKKVKRGFNMDEQAIEQVAETTPTEGSTSGSVDSGTSVAAADPVQTQERMVKQSDVDRVIGKVRSEAEAKAYARAQKEFEGRTKSLGGMEQKPTSQEDLERIVDERVEQRAQQAFAQQLVQDFTQKIKAGAGKYQDFDDVVSDLNLASNPHIVRWANGLDNTADVLYDLGKNPEKYASVMMLSQTTPNLALKKLQALSDSIKRNEEAKSAKTASEPLDQLKPSTTGMDNGNLTVSDYRKMPWLQA